MIESQVPTWLIQRANYFKPVIGRLVILLCGSANLCFSLHVYISVVFGHRCPYWY